MLNGMNVGNLFEECGKKRFGLAFGRAIEYEITPSRILPELYDVTFHKGIILAEDEQNWKKQLSKLELVCQCITVLTNKYGKIQVDFYTLGSTVTFKKPISYLEVQQKVKQTQEDFLKRMDIY